MSPGVTSPMVPETVGNRDLSEVDDKSANLQFLVERLEAEVPGIAERGDTGRMQFRRQQRLVAKHAHSLHQDALVLAVPGMPRRDATFGIKLVQGLRKGPHHMRRGCETSLAALCFHGAPLMYTSSASERA